MDEHFFVRDLEADDRHGVRLVLELKLLNVRDLAHQVAPLVGSRFRQRELTAHVLDQGRKGLATLIAPVDSGGEAGALVPGERRNRRLQDRRAG